LLNDVVIITVNNFVIYFMLLAIVDPFRTKIIFFMVDCYFHMLLPFGSIKFCVNIFHHSASAFNFDHPVFPLLNE